MTFKMHVNVLLSCKKKVGSLGNNLIVDHGRENDGFVG